MAIWVLVVFGNFHVYLPLLALSLVYRVIPVVYSHRSHFTIQNCDIFLVIIEDVFLRRIAGQRFALHVLIIRFNRTWLAPFLLECLEPL